MTDANACCTVLGLPLRGRFLRSLVSALVIYLSAAVLPFQMVFVPGHWGVFYWVTTVLFAADLALNFFTPVRKGMTMVTDRREIAARYLRGWFALDLLVALPLGPMLAGCQAQGAPGVLLAALPLVRLLKLAKLPDLLDEIFLGVGVGPSLGRLLSFMVWWLLACHGMSMGWIAIGANPPGTADTVPLLYMRAFYWCTTTIATIGYGDISPDRNNFWHMAYTVFVQVAGVGMFSYIIGNMATLIANLDVAKANYQKKMEDLDLFVRTKNIPPQLQEKMRNYYQYLWETKRSVSTSSAMDDLPESLGTEVSVFLNKDIIEKVPFFQHADEIFIREIIQGLRPLVFLPGDPIIRQGEYGECMYFLCAGDVEVLVQGKRVATLGSGSFFGEMALVRGEKRSATIRAVTYCDVYTLAKGNFDALRTRYPDFDQLVQKVVAARQAKEAKT